MADIIQEDIVNIIGKRPQSTSSTPSLSEFLADMQSRGVSFASRFDVQFTPPQAVLQYLTEWRSGFDPQILPIRCDTAELPGMSFITSDNKIYGPTYKQPYQVMFNEITLSFILSSNMDEKYFFDAWMSSIKDDSDNYGYYEDFVAPIKITQYDTANDGTYSVELINAFPTSVNALTLTWQDTEFHRLQVSFAYERWKPISLTPQVADPTINSGFLGLGQLGNTLKSLLPTVPGFNRIATFPGANQLLNGNFSLQTALEASKSVATTRGRNQVLNNPTISGAFNALGGSLPSSPLTNPLGKFFGI